LSYLEIQISKDKNRMKAFIIAGTLIGSYLGSLLPMLWGDSLFSISSVICGAIGGFLGIWISYKVAIRYL